MSKPKTLTHYTPVKAFGLPRSGRVALCGVRTNMGLLPRDENGEPEEEATYGSSNIDHVDCPECLAYTKA